MVPLRHPDQVDSTTCQLPYPSTHYEYGIAYNSREPLPVVCTSWNVGARLYNKDPYFVQSDNPTAGMRYGGFVFYTGTQADDDNCPIEQWRHRYWYINPDGGITVWAGNGCYGRGRNLTVYCRAR